MRCYWLPFSVKPRQHRPVTPRQHKATYLMLLGVYTVRSSDRLVGQTVAEPPTSVNQIIVACYYSTTRRLATTRVYDICSYVAMT